MAPPRLGILRPRRLRYEALEDRRLLSAYVWDHAAAVAYARTWCYSRNTERYHDYSSQGGDCANFVSQCLIAGGLDLSTGVHDSWGCIPSCDNLNAFLKSLGVESQTLYPSSTPKEPIWFVAGDVAIFGRGSDPWAHAVIAVSGDSAHWAGLDSHTPDVHTPDVSTNGVNWFYTQYPSLTECSFYDLVDHAEPASTQFMPGDLLRSTGAVNMRTGPCYGNPTVGTIPADATVRVLEDPENGKFYNGHYWWKVQHGDRVGWSADDWFVLDVRDTTRPTVSEFAVTPTSNLLGGTFTISYTVSDTGGAGLSRVELWRTDDLNAWPSEPEDQAVAMGNGPVSGSFSDVPPASGVWWYGLRVVDEAGNAITETEAGFQPQWVRVVPPALAIANPPAIGEGDSGTNDLVFVVTLSAPSPQWVEFRFATADGTAEAGRDYDEVDGIARIAPGELSAQIAVPIRGDLEYEDVEFFCVNLSDAVGATLADRQATGIILNDDREPTPGDANLDGKVDALDAAVLAAHWLQPGGAAWTDGDFNGDHRVDDLDASILAAHWRYVPGTGGQADEPAASEPNTDLRFIGPRPRPASTSAPRRLLSPAQKSLAAPSVLPVAPPTASSAPASSTNESLATKSRTAREAVLRKIPHQGELLYGPLAWAFGLQSARQPAKLRGLLRTDDRAVDLLLALDGPGVG